MSQNEKTEKNKEEEILESAHHSLIHADFPTDSQLENLLRIQLSAKMLQKLLAVADPNTPLLRLQEVDQHLAKIPQAAVAALQGQSAITRNPDLVFALLWSLYILLISKKIHCNNRSSPEISQEVKVHMNQIETKLRELDPKFTPNPDKKIRLNLLLARVLHERFFGAIEKQQTFAASEKLLQEISRIMDDTIKLLEKTASPSCIQKAQTLFHFGSTLKRWGTFRFGKDRWEPLFEQAAEKLNKCIEVCDNNSDLNAQEQKILQLFKRAAEEKLAHLQLFWMRCLQEPAHLYPQLRSTRAKFFENCIQFFTRVYPQHVFLARALYSYALLLAPSASILPDEIYQPLTDTIFALQNQSDNDWSTFVSIMTQSSPNHEEYKRPIIPRLKHLDPIRQMEPQVLAKRDELFNQVISILQPLEPELTFSQSTFLLADVNFELGSYRDWSESVSTTYSKSSAIYDALLQQKPNDITCLMRKGEVFYLLGKALVGEGGKRPHFVLTTAVDCWVSAGMGNMPEMQDCLKEAHDLRVKNVFKEGFMLKQGGVRKNWKERYFVLTMDSLCYYDCKKDVKVLKKNIPVPNIIQATAVQELKNLPSQKKKEFPFYMEVSVLKRTFYICVRTTEEQKSWLDALQYAKAQHSRNKKSEWKPKEEKKHQYRGFTIFGKGIDIQLQQMAQPSNDNMDTGVVESVAPQLPIQTPVAVIRPKSSDLELLSQHESQKTELQELRQKEEKLRTIYQTYLITLKEKELNLAALERDQKRLDAQVQMRMRLQALQPSNSVRCTALFDTGEPNDFGITRLQGTLAVAHTTYCLAHTIHGDHEERVLELRGLIEHALQEAQQHHEGSDSDGSNNMQNNKTSFTSTITNLEACCLKLSSFIPRQIPGDLKPYLKPWDQQSTFYTTLHELAYWEKNNGSNLDSPMLQVERIINFITQARDRLEHEYRLLTNKFYSSFLNMKIIVDILNALHTLTVNLTTEPFKEAIWPLFVKNGVFDVCMKFLQQKETDPVIIALVVKWFMRLTNAQIEPQREMVEKVFHIYFRTGSFFNVLARIMQQYSQLLIEGLNSGINFMLNEKILENCLSIVFFTITTIRHLATTSFHSHIIDSFSTCMEIRQLPIALVNLFTAWSHSLPRVTQLPRSPYFDEGLKSLMKLIASTLSIREFSMHYENDHAVVRQTLYILGSGECLFDALVLFSSFALARRMEPQHVRQLTHVLFHHITASKEKIILDRAIPALIYCYEQADLVFGAMKPVFMQSVAGIEDLIVVLKEQNREQLVQWVNEHQTIINSFAKENPVMYISLDTPPRSYSARNSSAIGHEAQQPHVSPLSGATVNQEQSPLFNKHSNSTHPSRNVARKLFAK